jgi:hypothetical protein
MQENKTPDFYFPTLASWGANIQNRGHLLTSPPLPDPLHDRSAWVHYKVGDYAPTALQIDNDALLPFYSWLAKQFTYCDYHFGLGTNSTPGHMLAIGGQTPTLRNPPGSTSPVWDLPTIFKHVEAGRHTWGAYTGTDLYPVTFYKELADPTSRKSIRAVTPTTCRRPMPNAQPLPALMANGGATIPAPDDAVVSAKPPKLPKGL